MSNETNQSAPPVVRVLSLKAIWLLRLLLAVLIVHGAVFVYRWQQKTAPKPKRREARERAAVIRTIELKRTSQKTIIVATGTVMPVRQLALSPRVSGEVVKVSPAWEPGGLLRAGTVAVELDKSDYLLAISRAETQVARAKSQLALSEVSLAQSRSQVAQAESKLVTAQYNHQVELGYQDVAKHEWDMLDSKTTATELERELTLRKPHLRKAVAEVTSAEAGIEVAKAAIKGAESTVTASRTSVRDAEVALEQAQLNLSRTAVKVPFNALVLARAVSLGAQVGTQTTLATLVDADKFWVEVSVPLDRVPWITVRAGEQPGANVVLRPSGTMADQVEWRGEIARCLPTLEEKGRQARYLVEVRNPMDRKPLPLLLDSFVQVQIAGPELQGVFAIPREAIHDGNQVWLRDAEGRLEVRDVEIVWSDADLVLVKDGLEEGLNLVVSNVASPVPGMQLSLEGEEPPEDMEKPTGGQPAEKGARQ